MVKSRYCFNTCHGKVGRRLTVWESFRMYLAMRKRARENREVVTFTWY